MATMGSQRVKSRKRVKKTPRVPRNVPTSMIVGRNRPHALGRKSRLSDDTMMTKRSNHMPMLMKIERTNINGMFVRKRLNQYSCGKRTLGVTIQTHAHQYGPVGRFLRKCAISYSLPENQAMKNSIEYAYPTRSDVRSRNLFISSRCRIKTMRSRLKTDRAMRSTVSTIAKPLKMAPATK